MINYTWDRNGALHVNMYSLFTDERVRNQMKAAAKYGPKHKARSRALTRHNMSRHDNSWFVTLTDKELIEYCRNPPKDCEFTELKIAADILAIRYENLLDGLEK